MANLPDGAMTDRDSSPSSAGQESPGAATITLPSFFPPDLVIAHLSQVREKQPVAALAAANQYQAALTDVFLQAVERGVRDPREDFAKHGMLFNYATYFLAKWREPRAYPLFLSWFSLPGEDALELGGDTVTHDGPRLLASVCPADPRGLQELVTNRAAHPVCRGQGIRALGVLASWNQLPLEALESQMAYFLREGLDPSPGPVWDYLAVVCAEMELLSNFPALRGAIEQGLVSSSVLTTESLDKIQAAPRGTLRDEFTQRHPPMGEVAQETRWWAGFNRNQPFLNPEPASPQPYLASPKVGRNDACPCGSGLKYKKCCGK